MKDVKQTNTLSVPVDFTTTFDIFAHSSKARYFRLGRHALLAALKIINIQPSDRILVPAFVCRDFLAPIYRLGATPIFYEVDYNLKPISFPELSNVCAVLAINYFGFAQDLSVFKAYCRQHKAILIEDNAHGFLSCDLTGMALGSRADLGIFSMRKTFSLPDGAMLMVNKLELQKSLEQQIAYSHEALPITFWVKRGLSWLQHATGIAFLMMATKIVRTTRYWHSGYAIAPLPKKNEFEMPNNPAPHLYSIKSLSKVDLIKEANRRRNLYDEFSNLLAKLDIKPVFVSLPVGTVPYGYPFYAEDNVAKIATLIANKQNFDCIRWPDLPDAILPTAPLHYQTLWMVNFTC